MRAILSTSPMKSNPIMIRRLRPLWLLLLLIGLFSSGARGAAQETEPPDTLKVVMPDSLARDSAAQTEEDRSGADTLINYSGDYIDFDVIRRVTVLTGNAVITYKDMRLEAERIEVDWDRQILTASGMPDTFYLDSARTEIDTVMVTGRPHF
ncbi:MAG: hypothetical protein NT025_06545, partial [bacterium]|nr:hypothetical protein [bacterium]